MLASLALMANGCSAVAERPSQPVHVSRVIPEAALDAQGKIAVLKVMPDNSDTVYHATVTNARFADGSTALISAAHALKGSERDGERNCNDAGAFITHPAAVSIDYAGTHYNPSDKPGEGSDIAVLQPQAGAVDELPQIDVGLLPELGEPVFTAGYSVHDTQPLAHVTAGEYLGTFGKEIVIAQEITSHIVGGNSGGPVVDETGKVFAIAQGITPDLSVSEINQLYDVDFEGDAKRYVVEHAVPIQQYVVDALKDMKSCQF